jgi:hypothetical protein
LGAEGRRGAYNVSLIEKSKSARYLRETKHHLPEPAIMEKLRTQATVECKKVALLFKS